MRAGRRSEKDGRSWNVGWTYFRITSASRPNWNRFRTTSRKMSNTSSPLAEQPEKKMTMRVKPQKSVMIRSRVL